MQTLSVMNRNIICNAKINKCYGMVIFLAENVDKDVKELECVTYSIHRKKQYYYILIIRENNSNEHRHRL